MDFSLSFEQTALKDGVARFVSTSHGFEEARRLACTDAGYSPTHWQQFADLGWLALLVSEQNGGLGGTLIDAALVMEELGRGLVAAPYISTAVLAALLLDAGETSAVRQSAIDSLVSGGSVIALASDAVPVDGGVRAESERDGYCLTGRTLMCIDGACATAFIVAATLEVGSSGGPALFHVAADSEGLVRRGYRTIDGRTAADLTFERVHVDAGDLLAASTVARHQLGRALDAARLMMAAEAIGIMEAAIQATIDYLQTRKQFGRALSTNQVLTHRVADMLVRKEHARSMLYRGLAHMEAPGPERAAAVSATMAAIIERAEFVGSQAIQLHGGIGMTEEYVVGHYYKRLRAIGKTYGDLGWHLGRFMEVPAASFEEEVAA